MDFTGPNEARARVREFLRDGVDFIKTMVTGGLGKPGEEPGNLEMEFEELAAIVDEAKKHNRKVACHCHSKKGMELVVSAGADSIEHATFLDQEINEKIIEKGIYIVPTFIPYVNFAEKGEENGALMDTVLAARVIMKEKTRRFGEACRQGVKIAFGRDSGGFMMDQGEYADEMACMERAGMTKADVIQSATENAARLCGIFDKTGSLAEGKYADLIILDKDPLKDLLSFRHALWAVFAEGTKV
jgi:imidazolonepropionase-like amidohydrolase